MPGPIARKAHQIADSGRFQMFIAGVIVFNALILGLETYDGLDEDYGDLLSALNDACLAIFVAEITIRARPSSTSWIDLPALQPVESLPNLA